MNFFFDDRCGKTRLMATCLRKPCRPSLSARNTSAMPPDSSFSTTRYRCWLSDMGFGARGLARKVTTRRSKPGSVRCPWPSAAGESAPSSVHAALCRGDGGTVPLVLVLVLVDSAPG